MHHTHRLFALCALFFVPLAASAQSLPTDPPLPSSPPLSTRDSNPPTLYAQWWKAATWWRDEAYRTRTALTTANTQVATLKAQIAATGASSGATVDLAPISAKLADISAAIGSVKANTDRLPTIDGSVAQLLAKANEPTGIRVTMVDGAPKIQWDYPVDEQSKVKEFVILRANAGLVGDTPKRIGFAFPSDRSWQHSATGTPAEAGTWNYYVQASTNNYLYIKDSPLSNAATVTIVPAGTTVAVLR